MKYTLDDLNDAVNEVDPEVAEARRAQAQAKFAVTEQLDAQPGVNPWGAVARAAANPAATREEMQEKMA